MDINKSGLFSQESLILEGAGREVMADVNRFFSKERLEQAAMQDERMRLARDLHDDAIRIGVRGVVLKEMAPRLLVHCIREVHAGRRWLEKGFATQAVEKLLQREAGAKDVARALTPRELQVAQMTAKGLHNEAIAEKLSISEGTAEVHLHHVCHKLDVDGRVALMQYLQSRGLA